MNTTTSILIIFPTMVLVTLIKNALANTNQLSRKIRFPFMLMMCCYLVISILAIIFSDQISRSNIVEKNPNSKIMINAFLLTFFITISIYSIGLSAYLDGKKCSVRYSWTIRKDWDQEKDKTKSLDPLSTVVKWLLRGVFVVCIIITIIFTDLSFKEGHIIAKSLSIISLIFEFFFAFTIKWMVDVIDENAKWNFLKNIIQNQINDQNKNQFNVKKIGDDANEVYKNLFSNIFYSTKSAKATNDNILETIRKILLDKDKGNFKDKTK